jgi:hypothetical protein
MAKNLKRKTAKKAVAKRAVKKAKKTRAKKATKRASAARRASWPKTKRKVARKAKTKVALPTIEQLVPGGEPQFVTPMDQVYRAFG